MSKIIKIVNNANLPVISWDKLKGQYKANDLKEKEDRDVSGLKKSILKFGFKFPIIIWEKGKYVADGAGRMLALELLEYEGYEIPDLPYLPLEAKNIKEAKENTLAITSQYGIITPESFGQFTFELKGMDLTYVNIDGYDIEELSWTPPLSKEIDMDDMKGKTKHQHTCPKCGFEFGTK